MAKDKKILSTGYDDPPPYTAAVGNLTKEKVLLVTTNDVPGFEIVSVAGVVCGTAVRHKTWLFSTGGMADGEYTKYTSYIVDSRKIAASRLCEAIEDIGCNAGCAMRFDIEFLPQSDCEAQVTCYATAVTIAPKHT